MRRRAGWARIRCVTDYAEAWRRTIRGERKSWVVFKHGTRVVLVDPDPATDLAAQAIGILRECGPVQLLRREEATAPVPVPAGVQVVDDRALERGAAR